MGIACRNTRRRAAGDVRPNARHLGARSGGDVAPTTYRASTAAHRGAADAPCSRAPASSSARTGINSRGRSPEIAPGPRQCRRAGAWPRWLLLPSQRWPPHARLSRRPRQATARGARRASGSTPRRRPARGALRARARARARWAATAARSTARKAVACARPPLALAGSAARRGRTPARARARNAPRASSPAAARRRAATAASRCAPPASRTAASAGR